MYICVLIMHVLHRDQVMKVINIPVCTELCVCTIYVVVPDPQQSVGNGSSGFCGRNWSVSYSLDVVAML